MKSIVTVDGTDVFSAKWTMEQMTALMNLIDSNRRRTYICYALNKKSFLGGQRSRVPSGAPKTEFSNENSVFYVSEGTRTGDRSVKKTCRWHVFSDESARRGPAQAGSPRAIRE